MAGGEQAILLDANVLILAAVGLFDIRLVGRGGLDEYSPEDLELLERRVAPFGRNLTTPHVLTEVNNGAENKVIPEGRYREFRQFFAEFVLRLEEQWMDAADLCQTEEFRRLGLSDAAVCRLADEQTVVVSNDAGLCGMQWGRGVNAENFNHLRGG